MTTSPVVNDAPLLEPHQSLGANLFGLAIQRALPVRGRRTVGPWCFLDRFGPVSFADGRPMDLGAHPHIGIQTVSWIMEGEIAHFDSLGNEAVLRPGGVNIMTAGSGIAHAEETPRENSGRLSGVQLWVALKDEHRNRDASFQHVAETPTLVLPGGIIRVFCGELQGAVSIAGHFSDLVGADLSVHKGESLSFALNPRFEHAFFALDGDAAFENQPLEHRTLYYLAPGRAEGTLRTGAGARLLLLGGPPFEEPLLMWWNFVARTPDEIREARADWENYARFGEIPGFKGHRLSAPEVLRLLAPSPTSAKLGGA